MIRNENALKDADEQEKNSLCPLCGCKPTAFAIRPNECSECWTPVSQWATIRALQAEHERPVGDPEIGLEIMRLERDKLQSELYEVILDDEIGLEIMRLERDEARKAAKAICTAVVCKDFRLYEVVSAAMEKWQWLKEGTINI